MIEIRQAEKGDLPAILAIYNHVIATTTAVYSEAPVTLEDRAIWLAEKQARGFPVFVAQEADDVLGFATFGDFRAWPCYRQTVEHSVHIRADARGRGLGRRLVREVLDGARALGMHMMIAGIDADNAASLALHYKLGFEDAGTLREVGRKFERWLDLTFLQKRLD
jgi:phosphinothricin acetyltransferase